MNSGHSSAGGKRVRANRSTCAVLTRAIGQCHSFLPVGFRGDRLWDDGPKASFPAARHRGFFLSNFLRCFCGLL